MMQPHELRVNNIIKNDEGLWRVVSLQITHSNREGNFLNNGISAIPINHTSTTQGELNFSGVPLTDLILYKIGFNENETRPVGIYAFGDTFSLFSRDDKNFEYDLDAGRKIYVKTLHQLQNLYYVVLQEELPTSRIYSSDITTLL
jgi:hypothetical protein